MGTLISQNIPYSGTTLSQQSLPIGAIVPYMGTTAPSGYLACDGGVYNISLYPLLAGFIEAQFGSINYFGGDGITTFAVPNISATVDDTASNHNHYIIKAKSDRLDRITFCEINDQSSADDVVWSGEKLTAILNTLCAPNAGAHNGIYRGKYLGTAVTEAQYNAISNGTFDDLYIGDYWTINDVNYRIAAFDYWLHTGDTECTAHHIVLVPDTCLYNAKMNDSNVVTGAYVGSKMYTTNLAAAKTTINNAFGSTHILNHREYLANAATNGYESAGAWYDSTVELMAEQMVYGGKIFTNGIQGTNWAQSHTIDKSQLPLFALEPSRICNRADWRLRGVANPTDFADVNAIGTASANYASYAYGVRPAFGIYKPAA